MKNISTPVVFFGTDHFSVAALESLIEAGYSIAAVVTKPDTKQGRGQKLTPPLVKTLASGHGIPTWQPDKLKDITPNIMELENPVGVLSSYGKIIPQSIIDLFTPGIINIHPSLLPKHRGPTPIETAIASGDSTTGVSIMQLTSGMDEGPVYAVKEHPLDGDETSPELYQTLASVGADLLIESLPGIIDGSLLPTPQNDSQATYTRLLTKEDAWLRPEEVTAIQAERLVRAHLGFPRTKITLDEHTIIITMAHVSNLSTGSVDIACKDGNYLVVDEVIAPSGRRMSAADFKRGYLRS